jgi:general secretion pathway protein C
MNINIDLNKIIKSLSPLLILTLIAFFINSILYFYLPKIYYTANNISSYDILFNKYYIKNSFSIDEKQNINNTVIEKKAYALISNISLQAIYKTEDNSGWIIISEQTSSKTTMLSIGDEFKGYKLKLIFIQYVIFEKNGKDYKLLLDNKSEKLNYDVVPVAQDDIETISDVEYIVPRDTIENYTTDMNKIWKDIGINEIKNNNNIITAFKVTKVQRGSIFDKLGLLKNDIIKSVNNVELKSYADAFKVYKNVNNITNVSMIIIRDNQEVELEYAIK